MVEPQPPAEFLDDLFVFEQEFNRKLLSPSLQRNAAIMYVFQLESIGIRLINTRTRTRTLPMPTYLLRSDQMMTNLIRVGDHLVTPPWTSKGF